MAARGPLERIKTAFPIHSNQHAYRGCRGGRMAFPDTAHGDVGTSAAIVALAVLVVSIAAWLLSRPGRQPVPPTAEASAVPDLNVLRAPHMADRDYLSPRELPAAPAIFMGRETEIQTLREKLDAHEGGSPFIAVVHGPGGIGKTALALSFAHLVYDLFPSGQVFVRVAEWDADPSIAIPRHAAVAEDPVARVAQTLVFALRSPGDRVPDVSQRDELLKLFHRMAADRTLIIVLDDVPAGVDLSPILKVAASCAIIITARQPPLGISADIDLPLSPLTKEDSLSILKKAIGHERVQQESDVAQDLVRLCQREPLALTLACAALAIRPHWKLSLVTGLVARATLTRRAPHETGPFDVAYWMLTEDEQYALRCIGAIGRARIAPWALQATLGDSEGDEARAVASRLARTGLIERTNSGAGGVPAYEVPESVAAYASRITGDEEKSAALDRLRAQQSRRNQEEPAVRIRKQVYPLMREGQLRESIERARDALALTRDNPNPSAEAECFAALAELYAELGEMSAAEDAAERALRIGEPDSRARAYRTLGKLQSREHRFGDAKHNLDLGLDLARQTGDRGEEIRILAERAMVLGRQEDFPQALDDARRAHELCASQNERQLPVALLAHGAVYLYMAGSKKTSEQSRPGYYARAAEIFDEGYVRTQDDERAQTLWMGWMLHAQARLAVEIGDLQSGRNFANEAVSSFKDNRHRYGVAHCRLLLGVINLRNGLPQEAAGELRSALETFRNCGDARAEADVSLILAQAFLRLDKPMQARRLQQAAVDRYLGLRDRAMAREAAVAVALTRLRRLGAGPTNPPRQSAAVRA